jgi:hypothetical protein
MEWQKPDIIELNGSNLGVSKCISGNAPKGYCIGGGTLSYVECYTGGAIALPLCIAGSSEY